MSKQNLTKTQKRRARRRRVTRHDIGPDLPIEGAVCVYIVVPTIPLKGAVGVRAGAIGDFVRHVFEPWLAEHNMLTKGLAVKVGRGNSVPTLMQEDLEAIQRSTKHIDNKVRRWRLSLFGYGLEMSVGKLGSTPLEVLEVDTHPGEPSEPPRPRAASAAVPRAGRPRGGSSAVN